MSKPVMSANQPSLTEWFAAIGETAEAEVFRREDNSKVDRLELLFQKVGMPYERPQKFPAADLATPSAAFLRLLQSDGDALCAIRLIPRRPGLPKLRNRGLPLRVCYEEWFLQQTIIPADYDAYVCPHSETLQWSATLVVTDTLIFGEIIRGLHSQLTHGETNAELLQFQFNFSDWAWLKKDNEAEREVKRMVSLLKIDEAVKRNKLEKHLDATFAGEYLKGYFEFTVWPDDTLYMIDYNRLLPRYIPAPPPLSPEDNLATSELKGMTAFAGVATGTVVQVTEANISSVSFPEGSILVCDNTDVRYLPYMRRAAAIVTNRGGILSHAAIVARELKKPCVIGTKVATSVLKDGDKVEVDAVKGIVRKL